MTHTMKRLLVIRFGALGDLLHLSPSLEAVKAAHPELEIHLLTSPMYQSLASLLPGVDKVWLWEKKSGWPGLLKAALDLRASRMDAVVNLHPSLKSWLLTQIVRPIRKAVYHKQKLKVKGQAQRALPRRHAVTDFYQPFRCLLGLPKDDAMTPRLPLPAALAETLPAKATGERWIGIIPGVGAKRSNRAWESESYVALIAQLLRHSEWPNLKILLIGGPDEQPLAQRLLEAVPGSHSDTVQSHCGLHDIPTTAALLSHCDLVIGGDTGPLHLAAAVGAPIVSIYGPTALARTGPVGNQPIQSLTPPEALACWPCELPTCPYTGPEHLACMKQIGVNEVLSAVFRQLRS
jgi:ADP-heptose:LPS heptosyltransferase